MPQTQNPKKHWCFTINNWTAEELDQIVEGLTRDDGVQIWEYLVVGREEGENGTPHLQGYGILKTKLRLRNVKLLPGFARAHLESARGTPKQASDYCKKEGDFEEFGDLPVSQQGKRNDIEDFKEWLKLQPYRPTNYEVADFWPRLWFNNRAACIEFMGLFTKPQPLLPEDVVLREWQRELDERVSGDADDRTLIFVVDENGNSGKSFLGKYWLDRRSDVAQMLRIGKRDDMAHTIDEDKSFFFFDVPRGCMQYLQYNVLEQLKDQLVYSPKYHSVMKRLRVTPHVVVFSNEHPDMTMMSRDRVQVINLRNLN